jgi:hypothetical protein
MMYFRFRVVGSSRCDDPARVQRAAGLVFSRLNEAEQPRHGGPIIRKEELGLEMSLSADRDIYWPLAFL